MKDEELSVSMYWWRTPAWQVCSSFTWGELELWARPIDLLFFFFKSCMFFSPLADLSLVSDWNSLVRSLRCVQGHQPIGEQVMWQYDRSDYMFVSEAGGVPEAAIKKSFSLMMSECHTLCNTLCVCVCVTAAVINTQTEHQSSHTWQEAEHTGVFTLTLRRCQTEALLKVNMTFVYCLDAAILFSSL